MPREIEETVRFRLYCDGREIGLISNPVYGEELSLGGRHFAVDAISHVKRQAWLKEVITPADSLAAENGHGVAQEIAAESLTLSTDVEKPIAVRLEIVVDRLAKAITVSIGTNVKVTVQAATS